MIVDAEGELTSAERLSYFYRGVPQESNSGTLFQFPFISVTSY